MAANPNHFAGQDNPIFSDSDIFKLVSETRKQATEVADAAREAIQAHYADPVLLASFIEDQQTPVYLFQHRLLGHAVLWALGFEPGFIPPGNDWRYQLLQRCLALPFSIHRKEKLGDTASRHARHGMFVLTRPLFTVGFISHQLHHWLAYRSGMQGYCEQSQRLYREFWNKRHGRLGPEVQNMKPEEIMALKAAINRDLEALQFLKSVAEEILIPAKQARRISHGNASA